MTLTIQIKVWYQAYDAYRRSIRACASACLFIYEDKHADDRMGVVRVSNTGSSERQARNVEEILLF